MAVMKMKGRSLQVEGVQKAPKLRFSQVLPKEMKQNEETKKVKSLAGPLKRWRRKKACRSLKTRGNGAMEEHRSRRNQQCVENIGR